MRDYVTRIFVFGSNLAGHHGGGSARAAMDEHGAVWGVGIGPTGNAYAIPTCDERIAPLPIDVIADHVRTFLVYAASHPFDVVAIGTGIAGFTAEQMAPLFAGAPENVVLPSGWREIAGPPR